MKRSVVLAIALASLLVRAVYLAGLSGTPGMEQHRWEQSDMAFFHAWGLALAGGDWLTDRALHPAHAWHPQVAAAYLAAHPGAAGDLETEADLARATRALWERWYGGKRFHQEPLYPYLVGLTYAALAAVGLDPAPRYVFLWQLGLGILTNLLVYAVARRAFGEGVGVMAGALAVLCGPVLFYELVLLRAAAIAAAGLGAVLLLQRALERRTPARFGLLGLALGAALMLKLVFAVLAAAALWLCAGRRAPWRPEVRGPLAALVAGLLLGIAPLVARNLAVGVPPLAFSSVGAMAFANANAADARPETGVRTSRFAAEILARSEGRLLPTMAAALATHPGPGSVAELLGKKVAVAWHWYEMPNNANYYYYALHAGVLRWLPVSFASVGPLALLGLALALRRPARPAQLWPLVALVACHLLALLGFEVLSRYRAPLVPALLPFAALALVQPLRWLREGRRGRVAACVLCVAAVAAVTLRPLPPGQPLIRSVDYRTPYGFYYRPRVEALWARGDREGAEALLAASLRVAPPELRDPARLAARGVPAERRALARFFAGIHRIRADNLRALGRSALAEDAERHAALLEGGSEGEDHGEDADPRPAGGP